MNAEKNRPRRTYPVEFKRKAIDMLKDGRDAAAVCKELGIQNPKTLENWRNLHRKGHLERAQKGRQDNHAVVAIQNALLKVLPDSPEGMSLATIRDSLEGEHGIDKCTETIRRHLKTLSDERGGYKVTVNAENEWCRNKSIKLALRSDELSVADALSLSLLERFLKPLLPTATINLLGGVFDQAKKKLEGESRRNGLAAWYDKVAVVEPGLEVIPPEPDKSVSQIVQDAMMAQQTVEIDYVSLEKKQGTYTVNPLGLVQSGAITYLVCTFSGTTSPIARLPVHRMKAAKRTYLKEPPPEEFSLQKFISEGGFQFFEKGPIEFRAWVSKSEGRRLEETKLGKDQKLVPEGDGFELTVTLIDSLRLRCWILSKTGEVVVLEPKALRDQIAERLREGTARYT